MNMSRQNIIKPAMESTVTMNKEEPLIEPKHDDANNERKESELHTTAAAIDESEFIPIPVIGTRTAGLSYIDPSIQINEDSTKLQFPSMHNFDLMVTKENKEEEYEREDPLMMHTVRSSLAVETNEVG